ncbi:MAG: DegT/DnrJ/EryC1/StrS family aminotransferase [Bacteroidales bacterium]|jgi:dTDP-4-amino-4,6-dideoxygalactose transaminase|nr:DegT/DnrJ/EryC1/StrS family aminotransferase [Bacteroidales bacterium]
MIKFVDLKSQYLTIKEEIDDAIRNVINETAFIGSKYVKTFEKEFADYIGIKNCIGVNNGTDALEIALESLELPKGSEVIVPANSFIASSEAVARNGYKTVFCDCNRSNYTLDVESLKQKISDKTQAVIAVHLYGHPCDMDEIKETIKSFSNIKIIEDCAQAHGTEYKGKKVGTLGDIAAFSFYPSKNLGAFGDGGAVLTQDDNLAKKIRMIGNHGRMDKYDHEFEGRNSRLDGMQAAILSVKLKYLDSWNQKRISLADKYFEELKDVEPVVLPRKEDFVKHVYHLFVVSVENRDGLKDFLFSNGIETGIHYPIALPKSKAYRYLNQGHERFFANENDNHLLSLPMGEHLSESDIIEVAQKIKEFYL